MYNFIWHNYIKSLLLSHSIPILFLLAYHNVEDKLQGLNQYDGVKIKGFLNYAAKPSVKRES